MPMIDISFKIFDSLEKQHVDPTANLINYKINRDGSTILLFIDDFNVNGYVVLSSSEANLWLGYKNAGKLIGYFPDITKKMPVKEVKEIHQAIWDRVIKTGSKPFTPYTNDCAACEYVAAFDVDKNNCFSKCPIAWSKSAKSYRCRCGIEYYNWTVSFSSKDGKVIRDIPFKFELKGKEK